ncbi:fibrobacter succinogenes major paralogous domain-containing protein [candidate division KSB1 bacterium]|nr:fibrobacter succinogenes major paralogous domain-containing protein [candidate division KSB1 bacterium]
MNTIKILAAAFLLLLMAPISSSQSSEKVKIGNQVWMTQNLDAGSFRNGDVIPEAKTKEEWIKAGEEGTPAWCYYENDPANGEKYGKLYNWHAVNDSRQLAPEGWHVPGHDEWQSLIDYYGGQEVAGAHMKEKGMAHWNSPNTGATNDHGFSALPGGHRDSKANFFNMGHYATFWSSTNCNNITAWKRHLSRGDAKVYIDCFNMIAGFSVRCVKD